MLTKLNQTTALFIVLFFSYFSLGCSPSSPEKKATIKAQGGSVMSLTKDIFGHLPDGQTIEIYTLTNSQGMKAKIMTYGATLVSLEVPDRNGERKDITLGHDHLKGYLKDSPYFGATVGRYANRIAQARFTLNGQTYQLAANDGPHHLHGGLKGFDKVVWQATPLEEEDWVGVRFFYLSPDGEEGYPGNLAVTVTYQLTEDNQLKIFYEAETDKPTPVNLTHHSYFNLKGQGEGDILDHILMINADYFTPVDSQLIPTGKIKSVKDTPWDFTTPHPIGQHIRKVPGGYDHNYVLNKEDSELSLAAHVFEPQSGRMMEIFTTEPGIQFYSGNFLDGSITGKAGRIYHQYYGFCLEPQHFPDSPNKPNFPSTILHPGEKYKSQTIFKFSIQK